MVLIEIETPAPFMSALELYTSIIGLKPLAAMAVTLQLSSATTYGLSRAGDLLVVLGFWPLAADRAEVFLAGRPPAMVAPCLVPLARACRLILDGRQHAGTVAMIAHVARGNRAGARLARIAGFHPAGAAGDFERWER